MCLLSICLCQCSFVPLQQFQVHFFQCLKSFFFKADINRMGAKFRVLTTRSSIYFEPAGAKEVDNTLIQFSCPSVKEN